MVDPLAGWAAFRQAFPVNAHRCIEHSKTCRVVASERIGLARAYGLATRICRQGHGGVGGGVETREAVDSNGLVAQQELQPTAWAVEVHSVGDGL